MSLDIDLYRSDDYVKFGRINLIRLLRDVFEPMLGRSLNGAVYRLSFHPVEDRRVLGGTPSVVNLRGSHGYVQVRITQDGELLYQHPHSIMEIVARPLQRLLAAEVPEEAHWGFGIVGPGLERLRLVRPKPEVTGSVDVSSGRHRQVFRLEEMPDPDPPFATLAQLGIDGWAAAPAPKAAVEPAGGTDSGAAPTVAPAGAASVGVVLSQEIHEQLLRGLAFSQEIEEGGFLVGHVYRNQDQPGQHLVSVSSVIQAERTGASLLHFTFTGESFLRMNDLLAQRQRDERLVGWYHTHLFAANEQVGLSSIDVELHSGTFRHPWQVAGLLNIVGTARTLRFYHWDGQKMVQASYWVGGGS